MNYEFKGPSLKTVNDKKSNASSSNDYQGLLAFKTGAFKTGNNFHPRN